MEYTTHWIVTDEIEKRGIILEKKENYCKKIFQQVYGTSENFMTPEIIGYGHINLDKHIVFELSQGTGFEHNLIFGVSVTDGINKLLDDSRGGFQELNEVVDYIKKLIKKYE